MSHQLDIVYAGTPLQKADKALIMIHGRGATQKAFSRYRNCLMWRARVVSSTGNK